MFFQKFDEKDEAATIKILDALSRFENHQDFGPDTVSNILRNSAIRKKIKDDDVSINETITLIKEELIKENERNILKAESLDNQLKAVSEKLEQEKLNHKESLMREKENILKLLDDQLNSIISDADSNWRRKKLLAIIVAILYYLGMIYLANHIGWNDFEMVSWALSLLLPLLTTLFFLISEGCISPKEALRKLKTRNQKNLIIKRKFDHQRYDQIKNELASEERKTEK